MALAGRYLRDTSRVWTSRALSALVLETRGPDTAVPVTGPASPTPPLVGAEEALANDGIISAQMITATSTQLRLCTSGVRLVS